MIKVENGTVQMMSPIEEMQKLMLSNNLTSKQASQVITSTDLSLLFHGLVDRYSLDDALTLWTLAVESYRDLTLKGEK